MKLATKWLLHSHCRSEADSGTFGRQGLRSSLAKQAATLGDSECLDDEAPVPASNFIIEAMRKLNCFRLSLGLLVLKLYPPLNYPKKGAVIGL